MNKNKLVLLFFLVCFGVFGSHLALAADPPAQNQGLQYELLEKIPGTSTISGSDLPGYLSALYKIALVVVTLSAVFMLSVGGFMYLTSAGNTASISSAKSIIYDSLIGLVIALAAWLVLYVINPDLVKVSLSTLPPVQITSGSPASPSPVGIGTLPTGDAISLAKQILASGNITLAATGDCRSVSGPVTPKKNVQDVANGKQMAACYAGPVCKTEGDRGCADNAVRPSDTMFRAIVAVGEKHSFTITSMAGGPHATNSKHYTGQAIDISPATQTLLDAFVKAGAIAPNGNAASMCEKAGKNVGCGGGADHIHLIFPN